jgi:predicted metal-dependent enzyme (double-stranded beta helix superfamily)
MFSKHQFIEDCAKAVKDGQAAVRELVQEAVSAPDGIYKELGTPSKAGIDLLHRSADLTVINFIWSPYMTLIPHNHNMFAVIGIYNGREDNVFWKRGEDGLEAAGADSMGAGDVATLGHNIIHSVSNPLGKYSAAIHVYGGDFFEPDEPRSEWDHETLQERPWDVETTRATFREAEERYLAHLAAAE